MVINEREIFIEKNYERLSEIVSSSLHLAKDAIRHELVSISGGATSVNIHDINDALYPNVDRKFILTISGITERYMIERDDYFDEDFIGDMGTMVRLVNREVSRVLGEVVSNVKIDYGRNRYAMGEFMITIVYSEKDLMESVISIFDVEIVKERKSFEVHYYIPLKSEEFSKKDYERLTSGFGIDSLLLGELRKVFSYAHFNPQCTNLMLRVGDEEKVVIDDVVRVIISYEKDRETIKEVEAIYSDSTSVIYNFNVGGVGNEFFTISYCG